VAQEQYVQIDKKDLKKDYFFVKMKSLVGINLRIRTPWRITSRNSLEKSCTSDSCYDMWCCTNPYFDLISRCNARPVTTSQPSDGGGDCFPHILNCFQCLKIGVPSGCPGETAIFKMIMIDDVTL